MRAELWYQGIPYFSGCSQKMLDASAWPKLTQQKVNAELLLCPVCSNTVAYSKLTLSAISHLSSSRAKATLLDP